MNRITENLQLVGVIDPASKSTGDLSLAGVDMNNNEKALFMVHVGVFGSSATVDMKLQESVDNTNDWTDIEGFAITQLAAAGGNNRLAAIELKRLQNSKRYVKALVSVGTAATVLSGYAFADGGNLPVATTAFAQVKTV